MKSNPADNLRPGQPRQPRRTRRGSIYILVLGMALLVAVLGAAAILTSRLRARSLSAGSDATAAQLYAQSAIALGRYAISADSNWRSTTSHPTTRWASSQPVGGPPSSVTSTTTTTPNVGLNVSLLGIGLGVGGGSSSTTTTTFAPNANTGWFTLDVTDLSGNQVSATDTSQPILMTATGAKGRSRHKVQVQLNPDLKPLTCLGVAADCGGTATLTSLTITGSTTVSTNASMTLTLCTLNSTKFEAVNTVSPLSCTPTSPPITNGIAARTLPVAASFNSNFAYYLNNGAKIDWSQVPNSGGIKTLSRVLISPLTNPYPVAGQPATNAQGIYVLDCNGQSLTISNCRIVGTLVLTNTSLSGPTISGSQVWEPAVANYPTLIVQGNLAFQPTTTALTETGGTNVNFNPAGVPYPYSSANADADTSDSYTSQQVGIIYCSGNLTTSQHPNVKGVLCASGTWTNSMTATIDLVYDNSYYLNPPPGFTTGSKMLPVSGTWKQLAN